MISLILLFKFLLLFQHSRQVSGSECGFPGSPRNGSLAGSGILFYPGEEATYKCSPGFVLFGPEKRTCTDNGTWTDTIPECRHNLALGKSSLQSATLWNYEPGLAVDADSDSCSFTPRSTEQRWWQVHLGDAASVQAVAVTISPGSYQKFTIFVIELLEGNKAMYKPCSKFDGKFETKKAIFLCNDGLGHPGQFVYIRDDREEQEYFGLCEVEVFEYRNETLCGDPEQPVSSMVNRTTQETVEYSCVKGFRMEGGSQTRVCQASGVWSGTPPKCIEVQCGDPLSVKDGFIEVSNFKGKYVFGSLATYHCNPGYILWGNASRLCAEDGQWTGGRPQCKPITCGQPPEVLNARFQLVNSSTSWLSLATYRCKPGFKMVHNKKNLTDIATVCTESGIWQPISFSCTFDPLAVNLKEGSSFGSWATFGEDGQMNLGTIAIIGVLSTLVLLVLIIVIIFFSHRRMSDESPTRKVSRSSTNQLIADVANGLAAHIDGPDPPNGSNFLIAASPARSGPGSGIGDAAVSPCSPYPNPDQMGEQHQQHQPMTSFRPPQSAVTHSMHGQLLPVPPPTPPGGHHSDCGRSAGDGGSVVDEANYATVKGLLGEEDTEEESHYSLIRRPDGRADETNYSTLREHPRAEAQSSSDDAGYESLHNHKRLPQELPLYAGIESAQVREQVYETLRKNSSGYESLPRSASSGTNGSASSASQVTVIKSQTGIIGLNGFARLNGKQGSSSGNTSPLYARVDRSKKKKNRDSNSSSNSSENSPVNDSSAGSPTKTLIDKFNGLDEHKRIIKVTANPAHSADSDTNTLGRYRPTTLYSPKESPRTNKEPMYATIGSKRSLASLRSADV